MIAASSIGLIVFSRGASFDIILTFPITASLVLFFIFDLTQRRKDAKTQRKFTKFLPLALFYFFIGVALIAKGLVGIVFPFAIVVVLSLLQFEISAEQTFSYQFDLGNNFEFARRFRLVSADVSGERLEIY